LIDLHCHILSGLDDGPAELEESLAMARVAVENGIETIVATPHVREDYPFPPEEIEPRVGELNAALGREGIELEVVAGAEVALSALETLDSATLERLCLGDGPYLLVESPYTDVTELLETGLFDLQMARLKPVLAHPERSPSFQRDPERLRRLVDQGMMTSVTAGSIAGRFGGGIRKLSGEMLREGLVHNIASDGHDARRRPPVLRIDGSAVGDFEWLTGTVPAAMLAGRELPERPRPRRRGWRRLVR
jgi:protein-tyrosine phosphatase